MKTAAALAVGSTAANKCTRLGNGCHLSARFLRGKQMRFACAAFAVLFSCCAFASPAPATMGRIESMQLLTPTVGWAATHSHVFSTTDGGQIWSDITPPRPSGAQEVMASVFFKSPSNGWVAFIGPRGRRARARTSVHRSSASGC
jgi:photosystem II stability/assembly factor-like uncharacterized protein